MTKLTDEQIRRHRHDVKARANAESKLNKNWKNRILEDDEDDSEACDETSGSDGFVP